MTTTILEKLFEHNNWANIQIIQACSPLSDGQLDAEPRSVTKGSIRRTLWHLVASQEGYLSHVTGKDWRSHWQAAPPLDELRQSAIRTGDELVAIARNEGRVPKDQVRTTNGYLVDPWVVMVQIINHATEHREQIKSMLSALGITPPDVDGWMYGEATGAMVPASG